LPVAPPTHDLRLRFALHEPGPDYAVTLQRVADGATLEEATLPSPDFVALEQTRLASLRAYVEQPLPHAFQETVGRELAALLPERIWQEIHAQWMQGLPQSGLRLRLAFDSRCHRLAALPWEYLYLTQEPISGFPGGFFAQQTGFHLWREAPKTVPGETLTTSMLRVLMVCANPGTPAYPSLPHLPAEVETLRAALTAERGRVDLREEGTATPDSLSNQLKQFRPHVVHFIGHGEEQTLGGILILHSGTKGSIAVSGEELASWLQGGELRLVVLSACQTASTRFSGQGVAQMLLTAGVPAVVAMQLPMRDSSGPKLTDELYRTLLRTGSIEEALWQARHRIQDVGPDWGVPTLHIAGNSGALFDFTPALPPGPVYLPAGHNPRFAGRDGVMEEMHQALMDPHPVPTTLVGLGGIGKTQLAIEYALKHQQDYPGGIFWFDARSTAALLESYVDYGQSDFEVSPGIPARRAAMRVQDALQKLPRPALLIYDNLNEGTELAHLPVVGPCRILITTREGWLVPQEYRAFKLPDLDADTALGLLLSPDQTYSAEEREAARELAEKVGRLPLALALIVRPARQEGFVAYRDRFVRHRMEALEQARRNFVTSTKHNGAIFDAIDLSYQRLEASAQTVLHAASCFAGQGISRDLLRQSASITDFDNAIQQLQDFSLLSAEENGRFSLHELVRVFAQGRMPETERSLLVQRLAEIWTRLLTDFNARNAWSEARVEIGHYRTLVELCGEEWAEQDIAIQHHRHPFLLQLAGFLTEQGEREEAVRYFEMGLRVVDGLYPQRNLHAVDFLLPLALTRQGDGDRRGAISLARQALRLARAESPPTSSEWAEYLREVGYLLRKLGHLRLALICLRRVLPILEAVHGRQHPQVARALNNLGVVYEHLNDLPPALAALNEAIAIDEQFFGPNSVQVATRLNNRGPVLGKMERWREAQSDHRRALEILEGIHSPEHLDIINTLWNLAEACYALHEKEESRRLYERILPIVEKFAGYNHPISQEIRDKLRLLLNTPKPTLEAD